MGIAPRVMLMVVVVSAVSCGTKSHDVVEEKEPARPPVEQDEDKELNEADKIRELLSIVRNSEHTFIQGGQERDGPAASADMERRVARLAAGVPTARQFIDRIGAGKLRADEPDTVKLTDGTVLPMRQWLLARLGELEGTPVQAEAAAGDAQLTQRARTNELGILDALRIVERSGLRFVAPPRKAVSGKIKGKRKEYTSTEFAEMLRKKWEFLGADIHDLDSFIEEIATDAFASFEPYRVIHNDGSEEPFREWLLGQLDQQRAALAKGG